MAIRINRSAGASKGSFANSKRVVTAPVRRPATPSRVPRQY